MMDIPVYTYTWLPDLAGVEVNWGDGTPPLRLDLEQLQILHLIGSDDCADDECGCYVAGKDDLLLDQDLDAAELDDDPM